MNIDKLLIGGFTMPLYSVFFSALFYALTQIIHLVPTQATIATSFGTLLVVISIAGYLSDFSDATKFPEQAFLYGIGAIIGILLFKNAIASAPNGIGSDAITSSIISVVLIFIGASVTFYLRYRNNMGTISRRIISG